MISLAGLFLTGHRRLLRAGRGHDHGGRRLGARLVDRAPRGAVPARHLGGQGQDPVPGPTPHRGAQVAGVGRHGPPGGGPARPGRAASRRWRSVRWPCPRSACASTARDVHRPASQPPGCEEPARHPAGVPWAAPQPGRGGQSPVHHLTGPAVRHAVAALQGRAAISAAPREPVTSTLLGHGQVLVVSVGLGLWRRPTPPRTRPCTTLRDQVLPATLGRGGRHQRTRSPGSPRATTTSPRNWTAGRRWSSCSSWAWRSCC